MARRRTMLITGIMLTGDVFHGIIKTAEVKEEELEGYRMWLDAKGGYF